MSRTPLHIGSNQDSPGFFAALDSGVLDSSACREQRAEKKRTMDGYHTMITFMYALASSPPSGPPRRRSPDPVICGDTGHNTNACIYHSSGMDCISIPQIISWCNLWCSDWLHHFQNLVRNCSCAQRELIKPASTDPPHAPHFACKNRLCAWLQLLWHFSNSKPPHPMTFSHHVSSNPLTSSISPRHVS